MQEAVEHARNVGKTRVAFKCRAKPHNGLREKCLFIDDLIIPTGLHLYSLITRSFESLKGIQGLKSLEHVLVNVVGFTTEQFTVEDSFHTCFMIKNPLISPQAFI